jgi:uncharacterized protein (TIGR03435 family)
MRRLGVLLGLAGLSLYGPIVCGQATEAPLSFDVASVKRSADPPPRFGTGEPDISNPGQIRFINKRMRAVLLWAYEVLSDDLLSGPGWLDSERYTIVAKFPPGTSQAQLHAMLQNLLVERFGLTLHRESRIQTAYDLTIGKNGSKLRPSSLDVKAPPEYEPDSPPLRLTNDGASFPQPPAGRKAMFFNSNGPIIRWTGQMQSLTDLASFLALRLGHQVTDKTGITGVYDFQLAYSKPPTMTANGAIDNAPTGGLNLERAVQEQLGLHLELAKGPVTYVVIDHIDREPVPN